MSSLLSRRSVLRTAAGGSFAVVAGCVSSDGDAQQPSNTDATTDSAPTDTATESATTTTNSAITAQFACDGVESPPTPAGTDEIAPEPYPDFPERLARSTVTEFVTAYERAYRYNRILARERNLTYVDVKRVGVADVEHTDEGFVVRVTVEFGWGERRESEGETLSSLHADGGSKVSYLVGERVLKRVAPDEWEFVDPRTTEGTLLRCGPATTTE